MKVILPVLLLAVVAISCSDNDENTGVHSDSTGHQSHQSGDTAHSQNAADSASATGRSMMSMMESMMTNMKSMKSTGNPDNDFAAMMKVHHLGAIEMAREEVAAGKDAQIKQMAQKMIDEQQKEVAELNTFLSGHAAHGGTDAFFKEAMTIMNNMKMEGDHSGSIDKQFVQMMIPHHQTAIDMSKAYLKAGHEPPLKAIANTIIASQEKEIRDLQAWLAKN